MLINRLNLKEMNDIVRNKWIKYKFMKNTRFELETYRYVNFDGAETLSTKLSLHILKIEIC